MDTLNTAPESLQGPWDVVIVGAGPAGLIAAVGVASSTRQRVLLLDSGPIVLDRTMDPAGYVSGIGGAGLFADGKLCLSLDVGGHLRADLSPEERQTLLEEVWTIFRNVLGLPPDTTIASAAAEFLPKGPVLDADLTYKYYPVVHIGTDRCKDVVVRITDALKARGVSLVAEHRLEAVRPVSDGWELSVRATPHGAEQSAETTSIRTQSLVLALGKVGAATQAAICRELGVKVEPLPMYVGVRLETSSSAIRGLFATRDPKYALSFGDGTKIKTHCAALGGVATRLEYDGLSIVGAHNPKKEVTTRGGFAVLWDGIRGVQGGYLAARDMMRRVSETTNARLLVQSLGDYQRHRPSQKDDLRALGITLDESDYEAGDVRPFLPAEYFERFDRFLHELSLAAPDILSTQTVLIAPAIEWWMDRVAVDPWSMRAAPGLYSCGDGAGWSQGIVHAAATGLLAAGAICGGRPSTEQVRQLFSMPGQAGEL